MPKKKITSLFVYQAICSLLTWAGKNKKRGFFIALCDGDKTHVAFRNLNKVSADASAVIGCNPELAAAFESIEVGVDCASEDCLKDPEWMKICNNLHIDEQTWRWVGFDFKEELSFQYVKRTEQQKGGAQ